MSFDLSKSGLPTKILIGPFEHTVTFKQLDIASETPVHGVYIFEDLELSFQPGQANKAFAADSVVHEVLHAIWRVNALNQEKLAAKDCEERIVSVLATALVQLLKANPKLAVWLQKQVT